MKYLKVLGIAILQAFLFILLEYTVLWIYIKDIVADNAGAIGIIGGADGPTAIFASSKFSSEFFQISFFLVMLILCFISNLSALVKEDKRLSVIILVLCCVLACILPTWSFTGVIGKWFLLVLSVLVILPGGYLISRKI